MSFRNILVPVRGDGKGEKVLDQAVSVAARLGAHIEVFHARMDAKDMLTFGVAASGRLHKEIAAVAEQHAEAEEERVRGLFDDYCQRHGLAVIDEPPAPSDKVSISWAEEQGRQASVIERRGRLSDLIVVPQPEGGLGLATFEAALIATGRPVMMVPPDGPPSRAQRIAIAWNGSAEAAGAVTASRPLIEAAESVHILTSMPDTDSSPGSEDLARYLRWHDQKADIIKMDCPPTSVGESLLENCAAREVDLLIMGGFGQMRRREFALGGVTEHIVLNSKIPVLFRH